MNRDYAIAREMARLRELVRAMPPDQPKPLMIGQAFSRTGNPESGGGGIALTGPCGVKLALLCGISLREFHDRVITTNLILRWPGRSGERGDLFPMDEARIQAERLMTEIIPECDGTILLGRSVTEAFSQLSGLEPLRCTSSLCTVVASGISWYTIPHPSGINRWWNLRTNEDAARELLRSVICRTRDETDAHSVSENPTEPGEIVKNGSQKKRSPFKTVFLRQKEKTV